MPLRASASSFSTFAATSSRRFTASASCCLVRSCQCSRFDSTSAIAFGLLAPLVRYVESSAGFIYRRVDDLLGRPHTAVFARPGQVWLLARADQFPVYLLACLVADHNGHAMEGYPIDGRVCRRMPLVNPQTRLLMRIHPVPVHP